MDRLFLIVLNMSLTGAFVIIAICLMRLPLKRVPKIISYAFGLKKSSRFAIICAVVLVAVAGFGLMTNQAQVVNHTTDTYDGVYGKSSTSVYPTACSDDYVIVYPGVNFNTDYGPPSRFNRDVPLTSTSTWFFPVNVPEHIRHAYTVDGNGLVYEVNRILINGPPLPMGWHLTNIDLGGRVHHLYNEFATHEIMLNPYTIALEYVVVDTPWTHEAEIAFMERADLMFDHFDELLAVSFRVQKVERADGMTNYKNAQLTRERTPIYGESKWCHHDYVIHLIPFYVTVFDMFGRISVTFQWVPAGFELYELENIVNSLLFEELGLQVELLRVPDTWLQYGPHVYSLAIDFAQTPNIWDKAECDETRAALENKAKYLFDIFGDLLRIHFFFNLTDYSWGGFPVYRHNS